MFGLAEHEGKCPTLCDIIDITNIIDINAINANIASMASLLIRNLSDETKKALRIKAAENGRSMTEEARSLIEVGMAKKTGPKNQRQEINWVDKMLADLRAIGDAEFEELPHIAAPPPPDFSGPEFAPRDDE